MKLNELARGERATIVRIGGRGAFRKRILEMGFIEGQTVEMLNKAPLGDPVRYKIMGYDVALRNAEAELVEIELCHEQETTRNIVEQSTPTEDLLGEKYRRRKKYGTTNGKLKELKIAFVGNPNCGKTSLFNFASGAHEKTGNYSGVTVDAREGHVSYNGYRLNIVDLPGTYSLTAYSPEERYVRDYILHSSPDIIINVVDVTNLERNLYLTLQLREMDAPCVLALNMWDELIERGDHLNHLVLAQAIGAPCIPTNGRTGRGIDKLLEAVIAVYEERYQSSSTPYLQYDKQLQDYAEKVRSIAVPLFQSPLSTYEVLKLIEGDPELSARVATSPNSSLLSEQLLQIAQEVAKTTQKDLETYCTDIRYKFLSRVVKQCYIAAPKLRKTTLKHRVDQILTHRLLGLPIFLFLMWFMFWTTFTLGQFPMDWIESGVAQLGEAIKELMDEGPLRDLLTDGIINGVGSVIVFLPQILILFLFISILEDTGYMARAVFLIDRTMRSFGLHGRSFIPLVMGFGCNVPAIMATRTIEDRKVRLATMLVNPFMSCSARLQVYILLVYSLFPRYAGTALFLVYFAGVFVALLAAFIMRKSFLKGNESPFIIELPPYRIPTLRSALHHMWDKGVQYLQKMGSVILIAALLIWFLGYFPRTTSQDAEYKAKIETIEQQYATLETTGTLSESQIQKRDSLITSLEWDWESIRQRESFLGRIGTTIEPALRPLGFDWRIGIGLVSGIAAKEVVVSTLGVLLQLGDENDENSPALRQKLHTVTWDSGPNKGKLLFTPLTSIALLIFVMLYVPCIAVIAAIRRESGSRKWAIFAALYTTGIAYIVALLVQQIGRLFI